MLSFLKRFAPAVELFENSAFEAVSDVIKTRLDELPKLGAKNWWGTGMCPHIYFIDEAVDYKDDTVKRCMTLGRGVGVYLVFLDDSHM